MVEVLSPGDRPDDVLAKCADWLTAGCSLVWVLDTDSHETRVRRADRSVSLVAAAEALAGADVLPGILCPWESALG